MKKLNRPVKKKQNMHGWSVYFLVGVILVMGIWIGILLEDGERASPSDQHVPQVFGVATMQIAKQFSCSCGSCGEKNLAACECPTAVSTKTFIEMNLNSGLNQEEIGNLVREVYGHYIGS